MSKKDSTQVYKIILFAVAALGFLALAFTAYKYVISNSTTSYSFADFLGHMGKDGAVGASGRNTAYTFFEWTSLIALICLGANAALALISFILEGLSVKAMKVFSIVGTLLTLVALICGYVYLSGINPLIGNYALGFAPWFMLIVSALHTLVLFYAFRK